MEGWGAFLNLNTNPLLKTKDYSEKNPYSSFIWPHVPSAYLSLHTLRPDLLYLLFSASCEVCCSNFEVVFFYTSKTKHTCGRHHHLSLTAELLESAGWPHRIQRNFVFLFQLPQQLLLKTDHYILFFSTSLSVHRRVLEKQLSRVLYYSMQFSMHISAYLPCPLQHFSPEQQMTWYLTYDPRIPKTTGWEAPP